MASDTGTGWLTFLHRAHDLRLYRYELSLEDGNRAFAMRENRTTYFGAITDPRVFKLWDRNDWLSSSECHTEGSPASGRKKITSVNLYDAETDELVDLYQNDKWQRWEAAKATRKEVERRNNWKLRGYLIAFWLAAAVFIWAVETVAGPYAGIAAGALAIMINLAISVVENILIVSQDAMFLLPR